MPTIKTSPHLKATAWTKTPNSLIDIWMPKLKDTELRVLLVVLRQTAGWNREGAEVSLSYRQFKTKTGRESDAISRALRSLAKRGLIHIRRERKHHAPAFPKDAPP